MTKNTSLQGIIKDLTKTDQDIPNSIPSDSPMSAYLKGVSEENFQKTSVVYIDQEVHEVISLLKRSKKFSMGNLFSMLGKEFIEKYDSEIKDSIANNNKYLAS